MPCPLVSPRRGAAHQNGAAETTKVTSRSPLDPRQNQPIKKIPIEIIALPFLARIMRYYSQLPRLQVAARQTQHCH